MRKIKLCFLAPIFAFFALMNPAFGQTPKPEPPTGLKTDIEIVKGQPAAKLTWKASSSKSVIGYNIYLGSGDKSNFVKINAHLIKETEYTVLGFTGKYSYKVTAVNAPCSQWASKDSEGVVVSLPLVQKTPEKSICGFIDVAEEAGMGKFPEPTRAHIKGYYIYMSEDGKNYYCLNSTPLANVESYCVYQLQLGKMYYFVFTSVGHDGIQGADSKCVSLVAWYQEGKVKATLVDEAGRDVFKNADFKGVSFGVWHDLDSERTKTDQETRPDPPTHLKAGLAFDGSVTLSWQTSPSRNICGYDIYYSPSGKRMYEKLNSHPVEGSEYIVASTKLPSGSFFFYVRSLIECCYLAESDFSETVTADTSPLWKDMPRRGLGYIDVAKKAGMKNYPRPNVVNIRGYNIYMMDVGKTQRLNKEPVPNVVSYVIKDLDVGQKCFFSIYAVAKDGSESAKCVNAPIIADYHFRLLKDDYAVSSDFK